LEDRVLKIKSSDPLKNPEYDQGYLRLREEVSKRWEELFNAQRMLKRTVVKTKTQRAALKN
jgi:hypothetical protein